MKKITDLTVITIKEEGIIDFSTVRNRELAKVKSGWVLFIDSDETVSQELEQEIRQAIKSKKYSAYRLHRLDTFLGQQLKYGENSHNSFVRLAKYDWGKWQRPVHEEWVGLPAVAGSGSIGNLTHPILHTPHASMSNFLTKINNYSTIEASYRHKLGKRSSLFKIAIFPPTKFFQNYLWRQGFRDGIPGTIMAVMMSFHSFLTWTKLYLLQQNKNA